MSSETIVKPAKRGTWMITIAILLAVGYGYVTFADLWTDNLWFSQLGFRQVFLTQMWTGLGLFLIFGAIMGIAVALTMVIAARLARKGGGRTSSALLNRYRDLLGRRLWLAALVPSLFFGFMAGFTAISALPLFLGYVNRTPFGVTDPKFGLDVSFFVFQYPWLRYVNSFALTTLILCAILAGVAHFALGMLTFGGVRPQGTARGAHAHISILVGLALVAYGFDQILDRYGLAVGNTSGLLDGMTYTDDHSRLTSLAVVAAIAFITAALFFVNAGRPSWRLPIASAILMVVTSLIVGIAYPAAVQQFDVAPDKPDKEAPYIEKHINATRAAYGINDVQVYDYSAQTTAAAGQLRSDAAAIPGIRLIDPAMVRETYEQLQQIRGFYSFSPVLDVDRYMIDGKETDVVIAARELDQNGVQNKEWNNLHTVYTHGYGIVAAYGNRRQAGGEPEWLAKDIPTVGKLTPTEPRIYFGELTSNYVVVGQPDGAGPVEFDTPGGGEQGGEQLYTYQGAGGVPIGSGITRALYATKFADVNLLLSNRVNSESKILYDRTPTDRVKQVAPWLTVDNDIYPAVVGGRILWIVDAYTTSNTYPNSAKVGLRGATGDQLVPTSSGLVPDSTVNYIRNSVKATVDAYDGTVTLYAWDESDPLLQTWMKTYPGSVQPKSAISAELRSHLRYPEDLFKVQRQVMARYHMTNTYQWFSQADLWTIPSNPVFEEKDNRREPTYFMSIKWPTATLNGATVQGDAGAVFSQTSVFVPSGRQNLTAYMAVVADAASPDYGRLRVLRMSDTQQIEGPGQAHNNILRDEKVANILRPYLNQGSAKALYGNLLTIPLGGGVLYVEPIYTQRSDAGQGAFPVLTFVVVRFGDHVGISDTLQGALDQVFAGDAGASTNEQPTQTGQPTSSSGTFDQAAVTTALQQAQQAFDAADLALKNGDLAGYQKANNDARAAIQRAIQSMGR